MAKRKSGSSRTLSNSPKEFPLTVRTGLFECYAFLAPNEYSEKTFGLLAFLVRSSVGEINFSSIMDKVQQKIQEKPKEIRSVPNDLSRANDYIQLLEKERTNLPEINASIEKCWMLNRLISYINENNAEFLSIVDHIREDMRLKMIDGTENQIINYPNDFRQREIDFDHRRNAQEMRRLFYLSHKEAREPPSLIHLQNRVTQHLDYLLQARKQYVSTFSHNGREELLKIIDNSFMITVHPCNGDIPVIIYKPIRSQYVAKINMTIVSLLHDFMRKYPDMIELQDIKFKLVPEEKSYRLQSSEPMIWQTCELQGHPSGRSPRMYFSELSSICVVQSHKDAAGVEFAQKLHAIELTVQLKINIKEFNISTTRLITFTSLKFAIAQRTSQIPRLLATVVLNDIQKYLNSSTPAVQNLIGFLSRYFMHRTGVFYNRSLLNFLQKELNQAQVERANFKTIEECFMDFLTSFVHQVEFMARHPVLCMFYTTKLFLGICDSEQVALSLKALSIDHFVITAFRLNTIRIDYKSIANKSIVGRVIQPSACAFRLDIFNHRNSCMENFTLDIDKMIQELNKLIYTSNDEKATKIQLFKSINQTNGQAEFESFDKYRKYYDSRLKKICVVQEEYQPLINLIRTANLLSNNDPHNDMNVPNDNTNNSGISAFCSTISSQRNHPENHVSTPSYIDNSNGTVSPQSILSSDQASYQKILEYVLSNVKLCTEIQEKLNTSPPMSTTASESLNQRQSFDVFDQYSPEETQISSQNLLTQAQPFHEFPSLLLSHEIERQSIHQTENSHQQQEQIFTTNLSEPEQDHCIDIFEQNADAFTFQLPEDIQDYLMNSIGEVSEDTLNQYV
ncbi:hypothetical protein I4U23_025504 [Adineta vaga]|nr:hypothetical protein I4U23_025504 [Adineta vaga]